MNKYSNAELLLFKEKLLKMKATEEAQLVSQNESLRMMFENGKEENGIDTTSYSTQIESILNSKNRIVKHLMQVNNALLRIANNRYGVCAGAGKLIPKERLMAIPTTTRSIEGKNIK